MISLRVHIKIGLLLLTGAMAVHVLAEEPRPARPAYHIYDQRATVVDMESLLRQQNPEPDATPTGDSQQLRQALREEFKRDKQFGFREVEVIRTLPQVQVEVEEEEETSWLTPSDLADEDDLQMEEELANSLESDLPTDVDEVVPWDELTESMVAEEMSEEDASSSEEDAAANINEDEDEFSRRTERSLLSGGLTLEPAVTTAAGFSETTGRSGQEDASGSFRDRDMGREAGLESSLSMGSGSFSSPEARALVDSLERDDFSRTRNAMQEISGKWERTADPVGTLSAPLGRSSDLSSWSPTASIDLPRTSMDTGNLRMRDVGGDLSNNSAIRSIQPVNVPRMDPISTVQDPMSRRTMMTAPAPQPVDINKFRQDEYRIRSGMGSGFPVGPFR